MPSPAADLHTPHKPHNPDAPILRAVGEHMPLLQVDRVGLQYRSATAVVVASGIPL